MCVCVCVCGTQIAERYQEVFASLAAMVGAVHVTNTALVAQLEAERAVGRQQVRARTDQHTHTDAAIFHAPAV